VDVYLCDPSCGLCLKPFNRNKKLGWKFENVG
jgi:hypothetical protein